MASPTPVEFVGASYVDKTIAALTGQQAAGTAAILPANPRRKALMINPTKACVLSLDTGPVWPLSAATANTISGAACPTGALYVTGLATGDKLVVLEAEVEDPSKLTPTAVVKPSLQVDGTPRVGKTFSVDVGEWVSADTVSAVFKLDGVAVSTGTQYVPQTTGVLTVEVTATNENGPSVEATTPVTVQAARPTAYVKPAVSPKGGGKGTTFSASDGQFSNVSSVARRWLLSGTAIGTGTTVTPTTGGELVLEVTGTGPGGVETLTTQPITIYDFGDAAPVTPTPTPTWSPANMDIIVFGDSRVEDGVGSAANQANGYNFGTGNLGFAGWLTTLGERKVRLGRYPNFGISASTLAQMAQEPRLDATGGASTGRWDRPSGSSNYASNKSASNVATHGAGIVVIHAGTNWSGTVASQLANLDTVLGNMGTSIHVVIINEVPRGVGYTGASQNAVPDATDRYTFSRELLKYDYRSDDAKARAKTIVANVWDEFADTPVLPARPNKRGYLRDGLHDTPYGAMRKAQVVIDTIKNAMGPTAWAALPALIPLPTANGFSTPAATQPFIHTNPTMTKTGTNGQVLGTWATAPAATNIPQGWTVSAGGGSSGIICVAEAGVETDPNGFGVLKLDFSGTIAANSNVIIQVYQNLAGSALTTALSSGNLALTDKLRMMMTTKTELGSLNLQGVSGKLLIQDTTGSRTITAKMRSGANGVAGGALNTYLDAGGTWCMDMTELADMRDPNLVSQNQNIAAIQQLQAIVEILFTNTTGSTANIGATVRIGATGAFRATS